MSTVGRYYLNSSCTYFCCSCYLWGKSSSPGTPVPPGVCGRYRLTGITRVLRKVASTEEVEEDQELLQPWVGCQLLSTQNQLKTFHVCYLIWSSPLSSDCSIYSSPMCDRKAEREIAYGNGNVFLKTLRNPQERKEAARSPGSQLQAEAGFASYQESLPYSAQDPPSFSFTNCHWLADCHSAWSQPSYWAELSLVTSEVPVTR